MFKKLVNSSWFQEDMNQWKTDYSNFGLDPFACALWLAVMGVAGFFLPSVWFVSNVWFLGLLMHLVCVTMLAGVITAVYVWSRNIVREYIL